MSRENDYGTKELHERHRVKPEFIGGGHSVRVRVIDQKVLDNLLLSERIGLRDYQTLDAMMVDYYNSTSGLKAHDYQPRVKSGRTDFSDKFALRKVKLKKVLDEVGEDLGREVRVIVEHIMEDIKLNKVQLMWIEASGNVQRLIKIIGRYYG